MTIATLIDAVSAEMRQASKPMQDILRKELSEFLEKELDKDNLTHIMLLKSNMRGCNEVRSEISR